MAEADTRASSWTGLGNADFLCEPVVISAEHLATAAVSVVADNATATAVADAAAFTIAAAGGIRSWEYYSPHADRSCRMR